MRLSISVGGAAISERHSARLKRQKRSGVTPTPSAAANIARHGVGSVIQGAAERFSDRRGGRTWIDVGLAELRQAHGLATASR